LSGVKAAGPKKAAGSKPKNLPRVDLAKKVAENTSLQSEVDECDMDDPVGRALCMGAYDPLSSSSAGWVWSGVKAVVPKKAAGPKPKKVKVGRLWGSRAADLQDDVDVDACDTSDEMLARALCIADDDPISSGNANWVLNMLGNDTKDEGWVGTTRGSVGSRSLNVPARSWTLPVEDSGFSKFL
jgi:hypothetical protein